MARHHGTPPRQAPRGKGTRGSQPASRPRHHAQACDASAMTRACQRAAMIASRHATMRHATTPPQRPAHHRDDQGALAAPLVPTPLPAMATAEARHRTESPGRDERAASTAVAVAYAGYNESGVLAAPPAALSATSLCGDTTRSATAAEPVQACHDHTKVATARHNGIEPRRRVTSNRRCAYTRSNEATRGDPDTMPMPQRRTEVRDAGPAHSCHDPRCNDDSVPPPPPRSQAIGTVQRQRLSATAASLIPCNRPSTRHHHCRRVNTNAQRLPGPGPRTNARCRTSSALQWRVASSQCHHHRDRLGARMLPLDCCTRPTPQCRRHHGVWTHSALGPPGPLCCAVCACPAR
jgi:hypothetical protein